MSWMLRVVATACSLLLLLSLPSSLCAQTGKSQREEKQDYFKKWLHEDVVYIITSQEREVFESLQTDAEKELFIEQFWARRDPDPTTPINEAREEHYRRIQYANDYFGSGGPGWRTDRGRIYITFGPPDRLDSYPAGQVYTRPLSRGGGRTTSLPYESWWYDNLPGIGPGIELEFVDASLAGEYKLALSPDEKDAMAHVPGAGETLYESLELTLRRLRPGPYGDPFSQTYADQPFVRLFRYDRVQRAPDFRTLSQRVTTRVHFSQINTAAAVHYLQRSPNLLTVPVTLTVSEGDLEYEELADLKAWISRVSVYGKVETVTGKVMQEFEERFQVHLNSQEYGQREGNRAFYQKLLALPPGRFKLSLIVQDEASGKLSTREESVILPDPVTQGLDASPIIVASSVSPEEAPTPEERAFRLSGYRVYPSTSLHFSKGRPVGIYLEAYPHGSQTTPAEVEAEIRLRHPGSAAIVKEFDISHSIESLNGRWLFAGLLPTSDLEAGNYLLEAEFRTPSGEKVVRESKFSLEP